MIFTTRVNSYIGTTIVVPDHAEVERGSASVTMYTLSTHQYMGRGGGFHNGVTYFMNGPLLTGLESHYASLCYPMRSIPSVYKHVGSIVVVLH